MGVGMTQKGKFLITGGAGFIGSHLCRNFLNYEKDSGGAFASSNEVICLSQFNNGKSNLHDLVDKPGFKMLKPNAEIKDEIDYILQFASYPSPKDFLAMPLETLYADSVGTMTMLNLAADKGAVFMLASTGHIDQEYNPTKESGIYSEGKRFAEAYTMAAHRKLGTQTRIIRMFNSYGPGMRIDDGRVVPAFIVKALKDEKLEIWGGDQLVSLTYIDDMIDGIKRVLFSDVIEPIEIGSPYRISIANLAKIIIGLCGSHSKLSLTPQLVKDERMPDLQRANDLGWSPKVDMVEGLTKTIDYFKGKI
jgi:dTDP-glucose 4,6-dehydratase